MARIPVFIDAVSPAEGRVGGHLRYTVPVMSDDRTIMGVLALDYAVSHLVSNLDLATEGTGYAVLDENGVALLWRMDEGEALPAREATLGQILRNRSGSFIESEAGGRLVVHARLLPREQIGLNLTLVQAIPFDQLYAPVRRLTYALGAGVAGTFLAAFAAMAIFVDRTVRPLLSLSELMQGYRPGKRAKVISRFLLRNDEVGNLYRSFRSMADALEEALEQAREQVKVLENKNAELARLTREAEDLARAKSDFLAIMSHEIRTPLNAIIGFSSLLRDETDASEQRFFIGRINEAGEHLLALIDNILDFTQLQSGRAKLAREPFQPYPEVVSMVEDARSRLPPGGPGLYYEFSGCREGRVLGDVVRLRQIVGNLLNNAIKFTAQGEISILVELKPPAGGRCWLEVVCRDTGPGIPEEKRKVIFNPFEQADSSRTRRYGGSGIGLALVARLTDLMGGEIVLESEVGQGSTFTVRLPLSAAEGSAPPDHKKLDSFQEHCPEDLTASTVLVVEDDPQNLEVCCRYLREFGLREVSAAKTMKEAADYLAKQRFHLVIMDLHLPDGRGEDLIREWRRKESFRAPVLAVTAFTGHDIVESATASGVDVVLHKPLRREDFYLEIMRLLGQQGTAGR